MKIKDRKLENFDDLKELIFIENFKQIEKWGVQNRTPFEWLTYLMEEVGELSEAVSNSVYDRSENNNENVVFEAIQVVTLSLKIAEMYLKKR